MNLLLMFLLALLALSAFFIVQTRKIIRMIIYLAAFSLILSLCFAMLAAPDVAIAEAVVSVFNTVIFIVALEKYYAPAAPAVTKSKAKKQAKIFKSIIPALISAALFALFIAFIPEGETNTLLKDQFVTRFTADVGGENAVTAIYLGYRVYDTLFEALMLLISITALIHISRHPDVTRKLDSRYRHIAESAIASVTIRLVSPILLLFGVYLIFNGHLSPGGGFQGGVVIAAFFVCRYIIYDISDISPPRILIAEKLIFLIIVLLVTAYVFTVTDALSVSAGQTVYLVAMNALIGAKVTCGFVIIFYRFIVIERL